VDRRQGRHTIYRDFVFQPLTQTGLADASKYQIGFLPDFQSLTIHRVEVRRDGAWSTRLKPGAITLARRETDFESDMSTGEVSALIVLDDVRVGDVVRISYSVDGANPVLAGLDTDVATFGGSSPLLRERMRLLFDSDARPVVVRDPRIPSEHVQDSAAGKSIAIEQGDLKPVAQEGSYPDWFIPSPRVIVAAQRSWKDVALWARDLYPAPKPLPDDLEELIRQWSKLPDQESRIVHALETVQDQVRYFGVEIGESSHRPAEPADVWRKRAGDCKDKARLLVAILTRMGVAAEPALVSSRGGRWVDDQPPSASAFDHVIVRVHLGARMLWLDPTRSGQRGSLDDHAVSDFGGALPIAEGVDRLTHVTQTAGALSRWQVDEHYRLDADGQRAQMVVTTDVSGVAAESLRNRLANTDRDTLQKDYRDYYAKRFKQVSVADPIQVRDDPAKNTIDVVETYQIEDPLIDLEGGLRGLETEADTIENFVRQPEGSSNHYPVALNHPVQIEQRIELDLPAGWKWEGESIHRSIEIPGMSYSLSAAQKDSQISFVHDYRSTSATVTGNDIDRLVAGEQQIDELVSRRFLISMTDPAKSRDDRLNRLVKGILDNGSGNSSSAADDKGK